VVGCGVDCHAMNFQPFGVFVQALRNTSLKLRGWPLISVRFAPKADKRADVSLSPLSADFVAKGVDGFREE
jgi:hypothetical protein